MHEHRENLMAPISFIFSIVVLVVLWRCKKCVNLGVASRMKAKALVRDPFKYGEEFLRTEPAQPIHEIQFDFMGCLGVQQGADNRRRHFGGNGFMWNTGYAGTNRWERDGSAAKYGKQVQCPLGRLANDRTRREMGGSCPQGNGMDDVFRGQITRCRDNDITHTSGRQLRGIGPDEVSPSMKYRRRHASAHGKEAVIGTDDNLHSGCCNVAEDKADY